jgi:hypothetical protein
MGRYMVLRMYSKKIAKIKQGKLIKQLHDEKEITDVVFDWAKKGICAALTANWLKKAERYRNGAGDELLQQALGQFEAYFKDDSLSPHELFAQVGLTDLTGILVSLPDNAPLAKHILSWWNNDKRAHRAVYISYKVEGRVSGSHAVGARKHGRHLHFFDPNCGWYEIESGREEHFFRVYQIALEDLGYKITPKKLYPVE